jgi:hypothetical protein
VSRRHYQLILKSLYLLVHTLHVYMRGTINASSGIRSHHAPSRRPIVFSINAYCVSRDAQLLSDCMLSDWGWIPDIGGSFLFAIAPSEWAPRPNQPPYTNRTAGLFILRSVVFPFRRFYRSKRRMSYMNVMSVRL